MQPGDLVAQQSGVLVADDGDLVERGRPAGFGGPESARVVRRCGGRDGQWYEASGQDFLG